MRQAKLFLGLIAVFLNCGEGISDSPTATPLKSDPSALLTSLCTMSADAVDCPSNSVDLTVDQLGLVKRKVFYQLPAGTPPAGGWPTVLLFQGTFFNSGLSFHGTSGQPFGAYYQALTVKQLLDAGFAILAPQTHLGGATFWDTNIPPWTVAWELSPDHAFMLAIFAAVTEGRFGSLDGGRLYATGISSGGYMTSRMAVSYPGKFKALAVHSGSYATCGGPLCAIPALPASHPPTLFLHGHDDLIVPEYTMEQYHAKLQAAGRRTSVIVHDLAGHQWIPEAPSAITDWFLGAP
jgi:poly(3-hydroxybutyrate) depolymerase